MRKSQMIDHAPACSRWAPGPQRLVTLLVEGTPAGRSWFLLAADVVADLAEVDRFLRETVLPQPPIQTTGSFRTLYRQRVFRARIDEPDSSVEGLDVRLDTLIGPDLRLWYDAGGAAPPLAIRILVERKGLSPQGKVRLLARSE
jgi:hypothetical protein